MIEKDQSFIRVFIYVINESFFNQLKKPDILKLSTLPLNK